jgi:hypothetical protein
MKVYALPDAVAAPEFSFDGDWQAREEAHRNQVRQWLKDNGYTGKNSGKIARFPVADGYAEYMLAEGSKSFLLHLPYGDGYQCREVGFLPKKEILARIDHQDRLDAMFNRNKGQAA